MTYTHRGTHLIATGYLASMRYCLQSISWHLDRPVNKPATVSIGINDRCCLRCRMCTIWKNRERKEELSTQDKVELMLALRSWLGPYEVSLAGGEPFLKAPEVLALAGTARDHGIATMVISNGLLIDGRLAQSIADSGVTSIKVSLDSLAPETHDYIRGVRGSHEKAVAAIRHLVRAARSSGTFVGVAVTVMEHNATELVRLANWAADEGLHSISFQAVQSPAWFGGGTFAEKWYLESDSWPKNPACVGEELQRLVELKGKGNPIANDLSELEWMKEYFREPQAAGKSRCFVGVKNLLIDPIGEVRLCFNMSPIGHISSGIERIWLGAEAAERRKQIRACSLSCSMLSCNQRRSPLALFRRWKTSTRRSRQALMNPVPGLSNPATPAGKWEQE